MRFAPGAVRATVLLLLAVPLARDAAAQSFLEGRQLAAAFSLKPVEPGLPRTTAPAGSAAPAAAAVSVTSGFVPPECRKLYDADSPRLVDCWLAQNPHVAQAIRWEFTGNGASQILSWPEWREESRQPVREAFMNARKWRASGMKTWPGPAYQDPPENKEAASLGPASVTTVLDGETAAWPFFTTQVGLSLAAEMGSWMSWSLRDFDDDALADLFDAPRRMYTYDSGDGSADDTVYAGYSPIGTVTPAFPITSFRFFADNRLIGATPLETVTAVLEWSRKHMQDAVRLSPSATEDPARLFHEAYWQYPGKAPLARVLAGTRVSDARVSRSFPEAVSWSGGCATTTDAIVWLLRAVNIPARRAGSPATCNHFTAYFPWAKAYLSHGNDAYHPLAKTASFTMDKLLVPAPIWQALFPKVRSGAWCWNVGRRVIDLNLRDPSDHLVGLYCEDTRAGVARESGQVHAAFENLYSMTQLKQRSLWERLAALAETSNADACVRLRAGR